MDLVIFPAFPIVFRDLCVNLFFFFCSYYLKTQSPNWSDNCTLLLPMHTSKLDVLLLHSKSCLSFQIKWSIQVQKTAPVSDYFLFIVQFYKVHVCTPILISVCFLCLVLVHIYRCKSCFQKTYLGTEIFVGKVKSSINS